MKVALVIDEFKTGGGLEHIYQIAKGLKDVEFFIFGRKAERDNRLSTLKNVRLIATTMTSLPLKVLNCRPDIIHVHHLKALLSIALNPIILSKIPTVFTVHGLHIHKYEFMKEISSKYKYHLRFLLEKFLFSKTSKVIAVSREDKQFLTEQYGLSNDKVIYIPNGVDCSEIEKLQISKHHVRISLNLPRRSFLFLTVARFNFQKGYDILVKSVALLKNYLNSKNVKFVLVGDGEEIGNIRSLVVKENLKNNFIFAGKRKDVYLFLKAADAFVLPSRWEGLPIVLIEAGYAKLPVIASNTYGNREVIEDGRTGVLFTNESPQDLSRKIRFFLNNYRKTLEYGQNLYKKVKLEYSLVRMTTGIRELYEELRMKKVRYLC